ncbi:MAG: hypothetical protein AB8G99_19530, partial [Planctomycetaceae bacterium]
MRILDAEIDLREETRTTEKAREAIRGIEYADRAERLAETQGDLTKRTAEVVLKIEDLPNADQFGKEIALLTEVARVMLEATGILAEPETGPRAIACETEAIELLLQARRIKPKGGGGGGGSTPGGGGSGTTNEAALALIGPGIDKDAT